MPVNFADATLAFKEELQTANNVPSTAIVNSMINTVQGEQQPLVYPVDVLLVLLFLFHHILLMDPQSSRYITAL